MNRGWTSLDTYNASSTIDHGVLLGLSDDDHIQYLLTNGNRDLTGDWTITSNDIIFNDNQGVKFGTGSDSYIYYDGTNMIIDPQQVGSGYCIINGIHMSAAVNANNIFIGYLTGAAVTTGNSNIGMGLGALDALTEAIDNVVIGKYAGSDLTTGDNNVLVGAYAGNNLTTNKENVAIGYASLYTANATGFNVAVGAYSGYQITWGNDNVFIGYYSGFSVVTGVKNIMIGYFAGFGETGGNKLYIENSGSTSPLIYGEFDNDLLRLNGATALTNAVHPMLYLRHQTSNTPVAGFGVSLNFELEDNAGNADVAAAIECIWTDAATTSEDADMVVKLKTAGAAIAERLRIDSVGNLSITAGTDQDIAVNFNATTNNGVFNWMEDEDYFKFNDDVNIDTLIASKPVWTDANKTLISKDVTACDVVRTHIVATTQTVTTGTLTSGTVSDVQTWGDGNEVHITEVAGVPGFDVRYTIANISDFCFIGVSFYYVGSSTHACEVQIYDDTNAIWRELYNQSGATLNHNYRFSDFPTTAADYINGSNEVLIRFYHPQNGNASHDLYIDYVSITGTSV